MDEARIAHLAMVQEVIGRMASNSLALKSLAATVAAAIIALAATQSGVETGAAPSSDASMVALVSLVPLATFWFLDGYYLRIEKAYRGLFDAVRKGDGSVEPFSMNHRPFRAGFLGTVRLSILSPVMVVYPALMLLILVISNSGWPTA